MSVFRSMEIGVIIKEIIMWPAEVISDVKAGDYKTVAVEVGVPYFAVGLPDFGAPIIEIAQWYLIVGGIVTAARYVIGDKSAAAPARNQ